MTEQEILEFARGLLPRWDGAWEIDGRPIGAFEMYAMTKLKRWEKRQQDSTEVEQKWLFQV